ncbi:MAG: hypothetical protein WBL80_03990 [Erysipelotrichaceae bacterium]
MFDTIVGLCTAFPSLNPFLIRDTSADEVILLINKLTRKGKAQHPDASPKIKVKKYADEVNWF